MPTRKSEDAAWPQHPSRLPLGWAWDGHCCAPGQQAATPSADEIKECNLGYAANCPRLPATRACDAVRFSVATERGSQLLLAFVCELGHRPASHGLLEYDFQLARWVSCHPDPCIQKMAECYLQSYLLRRNPSAPADLTLSPNS
jgi:hypothetical protein